MRQNSNTAENPAPNIFEAFSLSESELQVRVDKQLDPDFADPVDAYEIFEIIRNINDPEYPLSLEQLNVVNIERCEVAGDTVTVRITPTVPHCSMAQLIGLTVKTKLCRSLASSFKVKVIITEGTHSSEHEINKQLSDKERVCAALQNNSIMRVIRKGVLNTDTAPPFFTDLI